MCPNELGLVGVRDPLKEVSVEGILVWDDERT